MNVTLNLTLDHKEKGVLTCDWGTESIWSVIRIRYLDNNR